MPTEHGPGLTSKPAQAAIGPPPQGRQDHAVARSPMHALDLTLKNLDLSP
jgi:hypothetical protein